MGALPSRGKKLLEKMSLQREKQIRDPLEVSFYCPLEGQLQVADLKREAISVPLEGAFAL